MAIKRDAADKWFSDVVRQKAGFQCEHCGKKDGRMECAHIWGRAAKSVRWSMDNALCLCHYCQSSRFRGMAAKTCRAGSHGYFAREVASIDANKQKVKG